MVAWDRSRDRSGARQFLQTSVEFTQLVANALHVLGFEGRVRPPGRVPFDVDAAFAHTTNAPHPLVRAVLERPRLRRAGQPERGAQPIQRGLEISHQRFVLDHVKVEAARLGDSEDLTRAVGDGPGDVETLALARANSVVPLPMAPATKTGSKSGPEFKRPRTAGRTRPAQSPRSRNRAEAHSRITRSGGFKASLQRQAIGYRSRGAV